MFDLGRLEQRLNSDPQLQNAFLTDPVRVLAMEGVTLSADKQQKLRLMVAQAKMGEHIKVNLELNFIKLKDPNSRFQLNF